ncbi:AraC family transcriptional regulator [Yokenella regensburgei]|uniref:AraC family transcriptional regulator n=1 Tax=Yokenella regensburgei TaxID=158877 RepID=UPI003EDA564F
MSSIHHPERLNMAQDYRKQVFRAMDYISQHLAHNPTLEDVAREVALSSFHFHRIFKALVGETVAEFTRRLRMEKAAMRLIDAPYSDITGLALQSGFSSSQNFARAFRQHFSVSPGAFRLRYRPDTKSKAGHVPCQKSTYPQSDISEEQRRTAGLLGVSVVSLPTRRVAFMRRFGPYGKETCQQTHRDLLASLPERTPAHPAGTFCVYWDPPDVTAELRCRTDVGFELVPGEQVPRNIAVQTIAGGSYLVGQCAAHEEQVDHTWELAFAWMRTRGMIKSDKPCYEKYYNETNAACNFYVYDICIPLN